MQASTWEVWIWCIYFIKPRAAWNSGSFIRVFGATVPRPVALPIIERRRSLLTWPYTFISEVGSQSGKSSSWSKENTKEYRKQGRKEWKQKGRKFFTICSLIRNPFNSFVLISLSKPVKKEQVPVVAWCKTHVSWTAQTRWSWVRIPLKAWVYVWYFCVVLSCVGTGLAIGQSPVQGFLPKRLNGFVVSEVNSDSEQASGPNSWNVRTMKWRV